MQTYQLAKDTPFVVKGFGPLMTLEKAEYYQDQMTRAGFPVVILNTRAGSEYEGVSLGKGTNPKYWASFRKAKPKKPKTLFRHVAFSV